MHRVVTRPLSLRPHIRITMNRSHWEAGLRVLSPRLSTVLFIGNSVPVEAIIVFCC